MCNKLSISFLFTICLTSGLQSEPGMLIHAYYVDLFKKEPVSTEYNAYKLLKSEPLDTQINYLAVPWTILINTNQLQALPSIKLDGGFTICQHIQYEKIIPILKKIGIDTLFTPHAIKGKKYEGITILPFPHYAVNGTDPHEKKDLLYSFIGFDTHYTRKKIFNMPRLANTLIKQRAHWHFWGNKQEEEKKEYQEALARSRFSLCPRGTGASTIRFWESLQAGAIPILIADQMSLPEGVNWNNCIIQIAEKDTSNLQNIIQQISLSKEILMRINCIKAYKKFSGQNFVSNIRLYYDARP